MALTFIFSIQNLVNINRYAICDVILKFRNFLNRRIFSMGKCNFVLAEQVIFL